MQRFLSLCLFLSFLTLPLSSTPIKLEKFQLSEQDLFNYTEVNKKPKDNPFHLSLKAHETQKVDERYENIMKDLAYLQVFAVGTIGVIAALPEGVSNWSEEDKKFADIQGLLEKHAQNLDEGPALDKDSWGINYVGHSVAGSYFYIWGRQSGLSWQESAVLTTLMSTFFWEYGWGSICRNTFYTRPHNHPSSWFTSRRRYKLSLQQHYLQ